MLTLTAEPMDWTKLDIKDLPDGARYKTAPVSAQLGTRLALASNALDESMAKIFTKGAELYLDQNWDLIIRRLEIAASMRGMSVEDYCNEILKQKQ